MRYLSILLSAAALFLAGCIENDIPYPTVELNILSVEGEGFTVSSIDAVQKVVTLSLDEKTDIRNVRIDKVDVTEKATLSRELTGTFDLRTPIYVTLSLYQDYDWTIRAEQQIAREFTVAGQVGAAEFDAENRTATAHIPRGSDLGRLTVSALKLGPAGITTYSPTAEELSGSSFESVRQVDVTCHGRTERWLLNVLADASAITLTQADAWSRVVWLYASGIAGRTLGFRYRKEGSEQWIEVPDVKVDGGSLTARLTAEPETAYEIVAYCDDETSEVRKVVTEGVMQLPNCDMESWSQPKAPWLPYLSDADGNPTGQYWDTGNKGATTLGDKWNITEPVEELRPGASGKYAARLSTRYVVIKLAAGNLFVGQYAATRGTNGVVNFGRPFTLRPTAVRLWVKYECGQITRASDIGTVPPGETVSLNDYDTGSVFIALGTWTKEKYGYGKDDELFGTDECPVSIDTRDITRTAFNPRSEDVIAYGERLFHESTDGWQQITIPIDYRSTGEKPTHLIFVCSASRLGDYFTGSRDSKMWVDDVELIYE